MIYLSMLRLNLRSRQALSELRNPYEMHRTLSRGFGQAQDYANARCLYRVDAMPGDAMPIVLVQSLCEPDWQPLEELNGYLCCAAQKKAFQPTLAVGQTLSFRLRANPTVCRDGRRQSLWEPRPVGESVTEQEERLKRVEASHDAWMQRKAEAAGFEVLRCDLLRDDPVSFGTKSGQQTTLNAVRYDGQLRVTDAERLHYAIEHGIGSAKGFGFGLLSLARA